MERLAPTPTNTIMAEALQKRCSKTSMRQVAYCDKAKRQEVLFWHGRRHAPTFGAQRRTFFRKPLTAASMVWWVSNH